MNITSVLFDVVTEPHTSLERRSIKLKVPTELIEVLADYGSSVLEDLAHKTGAEITVLDQNEVGYIRIVAKHKNIREITVKVIDAISSIPRLGAIYNGTVVEISRTGAMVEILPGIVAMLPVFELSWEKISSPLAVLSVGEQIKVKLIDMDLYEGKFRLTRKFALPETLEL